MSGVAVVTGSARRIGLRIAERLAMAGYAVVLECSPCSLVAAREAAERIEERGGRAAVLAHDLSVESELCRVIAEAGAIFGPLSLLVNNASVFEDDAAASFDLELWDRHFAVNVRAPAVLSRDFARQLPSGLEGAIVNIIDQRVFRLTPQFFTYTLSKAALWTATRTMAQAFASQKIRVNAVGPGPALPNESQGEAGFSREVEGLLLKRPIAPDEIADAVLYLAGARNVTGQMIAVDAGQHLGWMTPDIVG
jgi:NAD(P)-dependent dehydrogenase (short-subunit alcohol dehydrogenase family)